MHLGTMWTRWFYRIGQVGVRDDNRGNTNFHDKAYQTQCTRPRNNFNASFTIKIIKKELFVTADNPKQED